MTQRDLMTKLPGIRKIYYILTNPSRKGLEDVCASLTTRGFRIVFSWSDADYPEYRYRLAAFSGLVLAYDAPGAEFEFIREGRCVIPVPVGSYAIYTDSVAAVAYSLEEARTQLEVIFTYLAESEVKLRRLADPDAKFGEADRKFIDSMVARFDLDAAIKGEC